MSLKKTTRRGYGTLHELNITPLLDLVFVLLVIFIITTPQLVNHLEMFLPSSRPASSLAQTPKPQIHRIVIDREGRIRFDQAAVTLVELKSALERQKSREPELGVVCQGADEMDYQHMIDVLDLLQQLEITRVGLATETDR